MTMPRHAARRDKNELPLVRIAIQLHWRLWKLDQPCDWLGLRRGQFFAIEIKNPDCEGHADEYTPQQKLFHADVKNCGGRVLVWRTELDVINDSQVRAIA